jgi:hypothetical protein
MEHKKGKYIRQYVTSPLPDVIDEMYENWDIEEYIWAHDSKLWKLAAEMYGDAREGWRIAWFNKKPTEAHFEIGDVILVPTNLAEIVNYIGR